MGLFSKRSKPESQGASQDDLKEPDFHDVLRAQLSEMYWNGEAVFRMMVMEMMVAANTAKSVAEALA